MSAPEPPTVRERRLARELREARITAQLTGADAARALDWSPSKLSRIETGRIGIKPADLDELITLYRLRDPQAEHLRRLAPAARARGWWDAYADSLSSGYAALLRLESGSRALRCYCAVIPHALLLTAEYAAANIRATWQTPSPAEIDRRIRVVQRRQAVLRPDDPRDGLQFSAVLDEAALRRSVAPSGSASGRAVHLGQLDHLIALAAWPTVELHVLPFNAGIPPVSSGSFSVLESAATAAPDVVYLENKTRIFYIDTEAEVHRYARDFEQLAEMALPGTAAIELIRSIGDEVRARD